MSRKTFGPKGRQNLPKIILQMGRHLVYSEGTKTEPLYVDSIKRAIAEKYFCGMNDIEIICANNKSYNTIGLVQYAKEDVKSRLVRKEKINHVWIFYDKDNFPIDDFTSAYHSINCMNDSLTVNDDGFKYELKTQISWHSCYSNEAFELWLLLYFDYMDVPRDRKQLIKDINNKDSLKKVNFVYGKSKENLHQIFTENGGSIDNAIRSAKRLVKNNKLQNPSTNVYEFAEYFNAYINSK